MTRSALLAFALALSGCHVSCSFVTDEADAHRALSNSGLTKITVGDWRFYGCGEGDLKGRDFTATNALGVVVNGVVCCGRTKGCTVRF